MKPKKSSLVLIIIFSLTMILGGTAVFIGYRLSQEEEITPIESEAATCSRGADCPACEYPKVAFCELEWDDANKSCVNGQCKCKKPPQPSGGCNEPSCQSVSDIQNCSPPDCDSGKENCGTSKSHEDGNCRKDSTKFCDTKCTTCSNPVRIYRYCKDEPTPPPKTLTCDDLSIDEQESVTITSGEAASGSLVAVAGGSITSDIQYTFATDPGYGSVDPSQATDGVSQGSSWSMTATQTESLVAGVHSDVIYVTVASDDLSDGGKGHANCSLDLNVSDKVVPAFDAEKDASIACINNDSAAQINYTIAVTNISDITGTILSIEDDYDDLIEEEWVSNIAPVPDSHSNNKITWNNNGDGYILEGGESLEFSYEVTVPKELFGEVINNIVTVTPKELPPIIKQKEVKITCLPPTGMFDNALKTTLLGLFMLLIGVLFLRFKEGINELFIFAEKKLSFSGIAQERKKRKVREFENNTLSDIEQDI